MSEHDYVEQPQENPLYPAPLPPPPPPELSTTPVTVQGGILEGEEVVVGIPLLTTHEENPQLPRPAPEGYQREMTERYFETIRRISFYDSILCLTLAPTNSIAAVCLILFPIAVYFGALHRQTGIMLPYICYTPAIVFFRGMLILIRPTVINIMVQSMAILLHVGIFVCVMKMFSKIIVIASNSSPARNTRAVVDVVEVPEIAMGMVVSLLPNNRGDESSSSSSSSTGSSSTSSITGSNRDLRDVPEIRLAA